MHSVSLRCADRGGPAWGDDVDGPLTVRAVCVCVGVLVLPFLCAEFFFKIHAREITKRAFRRGQGGSESRKEAGFHFPKRKGLVRT